MGYSLTPNKYLSYEEQGGLERILERHKGVDLRNSTMFLLMLWTGTRPSELLNLKWRDVDFISRRIFIDTLKGGRPRYIPICDELICRLVNLGVKELDDRIFDIGYRRFEKIWQEWRPVKKKLHSLRHTFAVNLYKKSGYNLRLVQQALGHAHITTTAIYLEIETSDAELRKCLINDGGGNAIKEELK